MRSPFVILLSVPVLLFTACCCGDMDSDGTGPVTESTPAPVDDNPAADRIKSAATCKSLGDHQQAVDPTTEFGPTDTVYFSMTVKGRPKEGVATGKFFWHDDLIAEASVDLGDPNSGVLFSFGEDTFAGFNLTPDNALPVSPHYRVEAFLDGDRVGSWPFAVVPPAGAIPARLHDAVLAHGSTDSYAPIRPATTFATADQVTIVGHVDFCTLCWLQVDWYVAGTLDGVGTRSFTANENAANTGFTFSFVPEGGWPAGTHEAVLTMNDHEVGRYAFTVE